LLPAPALPAQGDNPAGRAFQRDLLRELVEIDRTAASSTKAAEAMAARMRTAGFPESGMILAGASPDKGNLVVRLRGNDA
jgi:acetylornithine deacetylase/succinyl-diaminopimelate desuccinylase-like protein